LEPDIGEKEKKGMKKKTIYTNAPEDISDNILSGEKVFDFLPPPDQLVKKNPKIKVTITLSSRSVDFFKKYAKKNNVKYQTMINEVLDQYAQKYNESGSSSR
jgi:predicted DNA binding CopG/RHH family protein